jgi:hypothetical protein
MLRISFFLCALTLLPAIVNAASTANLGTVECTGSQTSNLTDAATFQCAGDFALLNGNIFSDSKIVISADGALYFENLLINAPAVEFTTLSGVLSLGSGVIINTNYFTVGIGDNVSPDVNVVSGAMITVGSGDAARLISADEISLSMVGGGSIPLVVGEPITIITAVPLPGAFGLMLSGFVALFGMSRRCASIGY